MKQIIAVVLACMAGLMASLVRPPRIGYAAGAQLATVAPDTSKTYTPRSGLSTVTDISNLPYALGTTVVTKTAAGQELRYKMVLAEDAALVVGDLVCYTTDDNNYEVTRDRAGGTSDNEQPAGLVVTAIADGACGWIQTYGPSQAAIVTDGSVAAGEAIIAHATTDGGADSSTGTSANAPDNTFGQALDADTGSALAANLLMLRCRD